MTNIQITVDVDDADAIGRAIKVLSLINGEVTPAETTVDEAAAKKAAAKKVAAKKAAAKKADAEKAETDAEESTEDDLSVEDVRKALKAYSALEGKPAAIKILTDHGAASIGELDAVEYASVITATE